MTIVPRADHPNDQYSEQDPLAVESPASESPLEAEAQTLDIADLLLHNAPAQPAAGVPPSDR